MAATSHPLGLHQSAKNFTHVESNTQTKIRVFPHPGNNPTLIPSGKCGGMVCAMMRLSRSRFPTDVLSSLSICSQTLIDYLILLFSACTPLSFLLAVQPQSGFNDEECGFFMEVPRTKNFKAEEYQYTRDNQVDENYVIVSERSLVQRVTSQKTVQGKVFGTHPSWSTGKVKHNHSQAHERSSTRCNPKLIALTWDCFSVHCPKQHTVENLWGFRSFSQRILKFHEGTPLHSKDNMTFSETTRKHKYIIQVLCNIWGRVGRSSYEVLRPQELLELRVFLFV